MPKLFAVLLGMVLIGVGTFFAQATTTGLVSRAATADRGSASGMYLASYFAGGLVGTAVLGQAFDRIGWSACVAGIAISLGVAAALALCLPFARPLCSVGRCLPERLRRDRCTEGIAAIG